MDSSKRYLYNYYLVTNLHSFITDNLVQDVEPETVSKISLLDLSPSESPIMVRQSFNDLNDPIISRDKYKDNEGQYSSLSDGYESENDIIEYDGLYF